MRRLSSPIEKLGGHWPVVVVGSGYGGAITASRLARAGQSVCVLERGKERVPGEFPRTGGQFLRETQVHLPGGEKADPQFGSNTGLFNLNLLGDLTIINGCGLGGTSLINAGVALRPDARILQDEHWPAAFRADVGGALADGFARAERMLGSRPYPESAPPLTKLQTLEASARHLGATLVRPPINVTFEEGVNDAGVRQRPCTLCGDCATGCNPGAKNTVLMNYLPDAQRHGAELFTHVAVHHVERGPGHWRVYYHLMNVGREVFKSPLQFLTADHVILAAGTLGSTEILLRSRAAGLSTSERLGQRFSANGDVMAFGYNLDVPVNAVGHGDDEDAEPVGPCITGIIDLRQDGPAEEGMVIEEGVIPGPLAGYLPPVFAAMSAIMGEDTDSGFVDGLAESVRMVDSVVRGPHHGALRNTQTYLVMSHDDGGGELKLDGEGMRAAWPDAGLQPSFQRVDTKLRAATAALGGTFVRNPTWTKLLDKSLIVTHPLGGCAMGDDAGKGVVDHEGRVFSGAAGTDVHAGLYVCDGAVIPRSLGANPLLTISAVSERFSARLAAREEWTIDYTPLPEVVNLETPRPLGILFTETLSGTIQPAPQHASVAAWANVDEESESPLRFIVTVMVEDLKALLANPDHPMRLTGTVVAPALSPKPLTVMSGVLNVLMPDPEEPDARRLRYGMHLQSEQGERFFLEGIKYVHDDPGLDLWSDTTTLFVTLWRGEDTSGLPAYQGVLHIALEEFVRQVTTLRVLHADDAQDRVKAMYDFGRFFVGGLAEVYWKPATLRALLDEAA
ncbi:GMC family oxidoreductase [Myxococcaceae bacterium GXIMD 01537]